MRWLTHELLGASGDLADAIASHVMVISDDHDLGAWLSAGADTLRVIPRLNGPGEMAQLLAKVIEGDRPPMVILPSTMWGKEVAGRLAARTGCGLVTDVTEFDLKEQQVGLWKSALSNSELVEIHVNTETTIVTLQPGMHRPVTRAGVSDVTLAPQLAQLPERDGPTIELLEELIEDDLEPLATAQLVIGLGLGVPSEAYPVIREFAGQLGAEIVGTRKLSDQNLIPRSRQVGATGRLLSSTVYLAVGISGKPMHVAGLNAVGTVLAINSDPNAPIFDHCDYGLVGTWEDGLNVLRLVLG
jgi:electron transfer flavoprotein alpha subunit